MIWNGFNHLLPLLRSHQCCSKLEMKIAPLWYNLPVEMETEKMDSQEGKGNKKISHCSSTKLIPQCLTKYLFLGGLEAWKRTSSPSDSPNEFYFYILSAISTFICFQCSLGCPLGISCLSSWEHVAGHSLHGWITKACQKRQLVRKHALLAEENITLWRK